MLLRKKLLQTSQLNTPMWHPEASAWQICHSIIALHLWAHVYNNNDAALRKPFPLLHHDCTTNAALVCINAAPEVLNAAPKTQMQLTKNRKCSSRRHKHSSLKTVNAALKTVTRIWKLYINVSMHTYERWSNVRYTTQLQHMQLTTDGGRKVSNSIRSMGR